MKLNAKQEEAYQHAPGYDPERWWPCFVCKRPLSADPSCQLCSDCREDHVAYFKKLGVASSCEMKWPMDAWPLWFRWSIFFDGENAFRDRQGFLRGYLSFFSLAPRPVSASQWRPLP